MRKIIVLILVLALLSPTAALAAEVATEKDTPSYTLPLLGYIIVVVPATEGSLTTIGVFKTTETGEAGERVTSFTLGGVLGKSVSTLAQTITPGPGHGQVVSAFVKAVNEERKKTKQAEIEKHKEEKERLREQKQEEKEERKEEHQQETGAGKGKGKEKGN